MKKNKQLKSRAGGGAGSRSMSAGSAAAAAAASGPRSHSNRAVAAPQAGEDDRTVFVRNLAAPLNTQQRMASHFGRFGKIASIDCNPEKGACMVSFRIPSAAAAALSHGRVLKVSVERSW